jgi:hypothetical protein
MAGGICFANCQLGIHDTEPTDPGMRARAGQTISELNVPHKVLSVLRNRQNAPFSDDTTAAYPHMHLLAGVYPNGGYRFLDVSLLDADNNTIGHKRVYNEREREDIFKFSGAFADYAAEKIAEIVSVH